MHLVLLNQYYPPDDAPTGVMLEEVAERLAGLGHRVTVVCGPGGYAPGAGESDDSAAPPKPEVCVKRVPATRLGRRSHAGRVIDYLSFYLGVAWVLVWLRPRPDRIVALTTPPYLSVLARLGSLWRRGDHAHWVMDLYPDVMVAHGMIRDGGVVARVLGALRRWGFGGRRCVEVVTLAPDMGERVERYLPAGKAATVVPLWASTGSAACAPQPRRRRDGSPATGQRGQGAGTDKGGSASPAEDPIRAWRRGRGWAEDDLVLLYSGNMGLGHRFGEFLEAARTFAGESRGAGGGLRMVFTGGGKRRGEIEDFVRAHPDVPVEVGDHVPRSDLAVHLASADVHLVSLEPAWDGTMVPSKLQGIFAAGRPAIFVGSRSGAIGRWIIESGAGWVVEPGDGAGVMAAIEAARDPDERQRRGAAARQFAEEHFDRDRNARRLAEVFSADGDHRPAAPRSPLRYVGIGLVWLLSLGVAAFILYLSWLPDSRLRQIEWLPEWLAQWADSGGQMMTMRTGVALAVAGLMFTLAWRVSGWRWAAVAGMAMSLILLGVAEGGQMLLPARTADWRDLWWGSAGAAVGVVVVAGIDALRWAGRRVARAVRG